MDIAEAYAKYRPRYPKGLVDLLVNRLSLSGEGSLLDIGCGTGLMALALSPYIKTVIGLDANSEMIQLAKRVTVAGRHVNVHWVVGRAELLPVDTDFAVTTFARSFHIVRAAEVLHRLSHMLNPDAWVVAVERTSPWSGQADWQRRLKAIMYQHCPRSSSERPEQVFAACGFRLAERIQMSFPERWTRANIRGYIQSISAIRSNVGGCRLLSDVDRALEQIRKSDLEGNAEFTLTLGHPGRQKGALRSYSG